MLKKPLRWIPFIVVCLVTLVALFYAEENWRGKHAWETYRHEQEAKGDSFEWSTVTPPMVSDDENFAMTPIFAELFPQPTTNAVLNKTKWLDCPTAAGDWHAGRIEDLAAWKACLGTNDLLGALVQYDPILKEITEASRRPKCRFPIRYEEIFLTTCPHLQLLRRLVRLLRVRALSELSVGQTDAALEDVRTCLRLAHTLHSDPLMLSFYHINGIMSEAAQPVWEGLVAHRWNDRQLAIIQSEFQQFTPFESAALAIRGERLFNDSEINWMIEHPDGRWQMYRELFGTSDAFGCVVLAHYHALPTGWLYQNLLAMDRFYTATCWPVAADFKDHKIRSAAWDRVDNSIGSTKFTVNNMLLAPLVPNNASLARVAAYSKTTMDEIDIACALERWRLTHGELPEKLTDLLPQYLEKLPVDVINGELLHYRRTAPDQFVLYSVGWNGVDDHGTIAFYGRAKRQHHSTKGDWVWFSSPQN